MHARTHARRGVGGGVDAHTVEQLTLQLARTAHYESIKSTLPL